MMAVNFGRANIKWRIQSWKLYSFSGIHVLEAVSGLVIYMLVDKKYPLTVKLMERMLDYQLEICHGTVGNELTTAVQLVKFLKKQIADSKHAGVHDLLKDLSLGSTEIDVIDALLDMYISTDIENGYHDSEGDIIYLESLIINDTIPNLSPEVFLDHDLKNLMDESDNEDLKSIVKDCPDYEDSRARGFVHRSLDLLSLHDFTWESDILDLID
ncbi:hypothetical protein Tco_1317214 [Tanacetum coccineum]